MKHTNAGSHLKLIYKTICRATTWRQCWIPGIDWEGHLCTMLQAKKQVSTPGRGVAQFQISANSLPPRSLVHLEPAEGRGKHRRTGPQWDDASSPCLQIWKHFIGRIIREAYDSCQDGLCPFIQGGYCIISNSSIGPVGHNI